MQRRAVTAYLVLFLVLAAGSYALLAAAESPEVTVGSPAETHANQSSFAVDGRTYTVAAVNAEVGEGGTVTREAELVWVNDSARYTETVENGSTLSLDGTDFRVRIPNATDGSPSSATLTEVQRTDLPNTTIDNTTYVVVESEDGNRTLVPEEQYLREQFGQPEERTLSVGDRLQYRNNSTRVDAITADELTLAWEAPRENTVTVSEGSNVTLNGVLHVARFPDNETVVLTTQIDTYLAQTADVERFEERIAGLWGAVILSLLAAAVLAGLAFLPRKDV